MQETWKLKVSPPIKASGLEEALPKIITQRQKELDIFLSFYFRKQGAIAEDVILKGAITYTSSGKGSFNVEFKVVHFNACLNIHEETNEKMHLHYEFFEESSTIILTGPYWPEREMDEI